MSEHVQDARDDGPRLEATAGWYAAEDPARERWWDGHRWTAMVRPSPHPLRVRWAGIPWGGPGSPVLQVLGGVVLLLVGRVALVVATSENPSRVHATVVTVLATLGGVALLVNAAVCWRLEARRTARPGGPPPEKQLAHVRRFGVVWASGRGWSQRSLAMGSLVVLVGLFVGGVTLLSRGVTSSWEDSLAGAAASLTLLLLGSFSIVDGCFRLVLERRRRSAYAIRARIEDHSPPTSDHHWTGPEHDVSTDW